MVDQCANAPCPASQPLWLLREAGSGTREAVEQALLPHLQYFDVAMQLGSPEAIKRITRADDAVDATV